MLRLTILKKFLKGFPSFNRIKGEKDEMRMKELTLLIGTCISCCMSAGFTNTNLQPIFENDMVRMNVQLNTLDGNQDGICDYQDGYYFCWIKITRIVFFMKMMIKTVFAIIVREKRVQPM